MIKIGKLETVETSTGIRLQAHVNIDAKATQLTLDVDKQWGEYLVTEVSDAFLWSALRYAMIHCHDIDVATPVSEQFLHNITEHYLPCLQLTDPTVHKPAITTPPSPGDNAFSFGKGVGASISCGVDSLYTVKKYLDSPYPSLNLTHLFLTTQGLFGQYVNPLQSRNAIFDRGRKVSAHLNLPFVNVISNISAVFPQNYGNAPAYSTMLSVLSLRKLFCVYHYASGYDIGHFKISNNSYEDCSLFDLLITNVLTVPGFRLYHSGGEMTRAQKTKYIADFEIAKKYLSVCVRDGEKNDNICLKCRRTLLHADMMGVLNDFKDVFDIDYYLKNKADYFRYLCTQGTSKYMSDTYQYFAVTEPELLNQGRKMIKRR
jgi:hypothetical protein